MLRAQHAREIHLREAARLNGLHRTLQELMSMGLIEVEQEGDERPRFRAVQNGGQSDVF